jgi:hypothetical protein
MGPEDLEVDRRFLARAARLMRWYPRDWRARYGHEFESVLHSSLRDGKWGLRLSVDVAREGLLTRLEGAGFVGRSAPPLERARASLITIFVAAMGFLGTAAVLAHYVRNWRGYPISESVEKVYRAETALGAGSADRVQRTAIARELNSAYAHPASGAPMVFDRITHISVAAAIVCLGLVLGLAVVSGALALRKGSRAPLLRPLSMILLGAFLCTFGEIALHTYTLPGPGVWTALRLVVVDGRFRLWPLAAFPLCATAAVVLVAVGTSKLLRRVQSKTWVWRLQGSFGVAAASCLAVALLSTLAWAATLYVQAPGFLTLSSQGVLGTPLLPIFAVAVVLMAGASCLAAVGSARYLHSAG